MEDSRADYVLTSENGEHASRFAIFDRPVRLVMSWISGVDYSDGRKKNSLVRASERKSLYSARYFRYTVVLFFLYIFLGLGYYTGHVGFTVLDSIYFIIISFYTVGYGDYVPETVNQRVFTTFYACIGFSLLCVIGVTAGDFFHNAVNMNNYARTQRVLEVISQARVEMKIEKAADESDRDTSGSRDSRTSHDSRVSGSFGSAARKVPSRRLSMIDKEKQGDIFPSPYSIKDPRVIELMRKVNMDMFDEELDAIKNKTKKDFVMILVILFVGTICMGFIEDWAAEDALYWSCVTIATIGYGDVAPETDGGKTFTIFYCLFGIGLMAKAVTDLASYPFLMREKKTELQVLMQFGTDLSEEQLSTIQNHELINAVPRLRKSKNRVEKSEFVLILLQLMDKVQDTDIVYISEIFDALDKTKDGFLSDAELAKEMEEARQRSRSILASRPDGDSTTRSSITESLGSIKNLFKGSGAEPKKSTTYAAMSEPRVPFTTAPAAGNSSYQPPTAPARGVHRGASSPSVLGLFPATASPMQAGEAAAVDVDRPEESNGQGPAL